jgi:hypothetical protein
VQKSFSPKGLRNQFPGSENLTYNYSQADQDIFVLSILNGKCNGTYLEIGCGDEFNINNTALLETKFEWTGVSIDTHKLYADTWTRQNPIETANGITVDYLDLLQRHNISATNLDYLSIDCDPPDQTLCILKCLPLDKIRFAVITFEHDCYAHGPDVKNKSRAYLESYGYQLVVSNISDCGLARDFEDWWVHPELVDSAMVSMHTDLRDITKDYSWYLYNRIPEVLKNTDFVKQFYRNTP